MEKYDVTVIGGGPGGYVAAIRAAKLGGKVALVEKDHLGGTCLNKGCIPTKTLVHGAHVYKQVKNAEEWGISTGGVQIDIEKLILKKKQVVEGLKQGIKQLMDANKIKVFYGYGKIIKPDKVLVLGANEKHEINTKKIILATGSKPLVPPIPGIKLPGIITSDDALNMKEIPQNLVVIGAGVIGLEFACFYAKLGTKVTVLEAQANMLPMVDEEIVKRTIPVFKRQGIKIEMGALVKNIKKNNSQLVVEYFGKKGEAEINCDKLLIATGRKPCLEEEALGSIDLELEKGFLKVNSRLETNIPNIYAIGDIINSPMLAHVASAEGMVAAENALGINTEINYNVIPGCIYTSPEISNVGLTEKEAKVKYGEIKVCKVPFSSNGRALTIGEQMGMLKIIMDAKTEKLVGAHIFGVQASELIAEICLAMENSLTVQAIAQTVHSHPTLSEIIAEGAHVLLDSPIHTI